MAASELFHHIEFMLETGRDAHGPLPVPLTNLFLQCLICHMILSVTFRIAFCFFLQF
ncbi:MAG: hypothetical protein KJ729_00525 [Euryarchaeota archaeon]|nr:hypothetical protein [Euryarchaeota archaeon]